ncbi:MAG: Rab family GTPase [Candidatus Heimdallarchaeota archaeon]
MIERRPLKETPDYKLKIIVAGAGGVGKTTLVHRFLSGQFLKFSMTIGVSFQTHTLVLKNNKTVKLIIWDLGGQERFRQMSVFESYCIGAHGIILALDMTSAVRTIQELNDWTTIVRGGAPNAPIVLIGTKADLMIEGIDLPRDLIDHFIEENDIQGFFETSSLTGQNVQETFIHLVNLILKQSNLRGEATSETAI